MILHLLKLLFFHILHVFCLRDTVQSVLQCCEIFLVKRHWLDIR